MCVCRRKKELAGCPVLRLRIQPFHHLRPDARWQKTEVRETTATFACPLDRTSAWA